jgi:lipoprotein NlpI
MTRGARLRCVVGAPLLGVVLAAAAPATQDKNDVGGAVARCSDPRSAPSDVLAACNSALRPGVLSARGFALAHSRIADMLALSELFDDALAHYDAALRAEPDFIPARFGRSDAYFKQRRHDAALADIDEVIRLRPDLAAALSKRGQLLDFSGRFDEAVAAFSEAIARQPTAGRYVDRGIAYVNKGDHEHAFADYEEAIKRDPRDAGAYAARGRLHILRDEFTEAATDMKAAADLDPRYPYPLIWLYIARSRLGEDAAADLERRAAALDLEEWPGPVVSLLLGRLPPDAVRPPDNPSRLIDLGQWCEAHFYLGEYHLLHGDEQAAERELEAAAALGVIEYVEHFHALHELQRFRR